MFYKEKRIPDGIKGRSFQVNKISQLMTKQITIIAQMKKIIIQNQLYKFVKDLEMLFMKVNILALMVKVLLRNI